MKKTEACSRAFLSDRSHSCFSEERHNGPLLPRKQWHRALRHTFHFCLFALGFAATTSVALAQNVGVSAQHSIVGVSTDTDGRTWLTLSVTLTNGGDMDLTDVRLLTSPGLSPAPGTEPDALLIGDLAVDTSVTKDWTFESLFPSTEVLPGPVLFLGEATDSFGDFIAFPVDSLEGE
ncbi:MAG: hypothetical protein PVG42_03740 [Lysobacterales bacterium]|jgi:hypothetical protein